MAAYRLDCVGLSDTGRVRDHNEDSIGWDETHNLAVLADGMGGYSAGEVASRMAVEGLLQGIRIPSPESVSEASLTQLVGDVNQQIFQRSQEIPDCKRMGTTLALICLVEDQVLIAHAGDSRVYRWRNGRLEQMTQDHSLVQQLVDEGTISKDDAECSRYRNVVTRALGVRPECEVEISRHEVQPADVFVLCSDGLSNMVSEADLNTIISACADDRQQAAQRLVDQANRAGGEDNISVVLAVAAPTSPLAAEHDGLRIEDNDKWQK